MSKLFVEITPHDGGKVNDRTIAVLLIAMGKDIGLQDSDVIKESPGERRVLLTTDFCGLRAELIAAPNGGGHA